MAQAGKRYPLLVYENTLKRWYPATFVLSIMLLVFWWFLPEILPGKTGQDWVDFTLLFSSGGAFFITILFLVIRKAAYARAYKTYLRVATPFFRVNISYKRFLKTTSTEMNRLFPPSSLSNWTREMMAPLMSKTAIVVELKSFPLPLPVLRLFLSSFFFKDKSPHIVILVDNWMRFSTELESFRSGGDIEDPNKKKKRSSVLSSLTREE